LTGFLGWEASGGDLTVVDFVLSCRAMGRNVESLMVALLVETARTQGRRVVAQGLPTERNRPCLEFWRRSGCVEADACRFVWDSSVPFPRPESIEVLVPSGVAVQDE
jgi:predicted enzyme involved in methoxymalonyl-ACP biosynthesis